MRAYVQQVKQDATFYLASLEASHWFWERGYEVVPFRFADIQAGALDDWLLNRADEMLVRAGVEATRLLLSRAGRPHPPNFDLPDSLSPWIGRFTWETTLGEVRDQVDSAVPFNPFHVKPLFHSKLFKGTVVYGLRDLIASAAVPDDTPVLAQQRIEFISEWRVSILRDKILNVGHYKGNPLRFPNVEVVQAAIESFADRPIAFGMDWGITAAGQTLLVEVNDAYALENVGLGGMPFTAMIEARWRELMGLPDNGVGECFSR
ncbi:MAG: ATP-grasp domain-containing protein [Pirellula sp.]